MKLTEGQKELNAQKKLNAQQELEERMKFFNLLSEYNLSLPDKVDTTGLLFLSFLILSKDSIKIISDNINKELRIKSKQ